MSKRASETVRNKISEKLIQLMERDNISQYRLAKELDVGEAHISRLRNGKYAPSHQLLIDIADYFKVSTDFLYGRK